jgi:ABC-type Zn uptake system ZnuABC Zn-binding protein ZnuA
MWNYCDIAYKACTRRVLLHHLVAIVQLVNEIGIKVIYSEDLINIRSAQVIARDFRWKSGSTLAY